MSWAEWQKSAWAGAVVEPVGAFPRRSEIECPNTLDIDKRVCKARLIDTPILIECGSEWRRICHCEVCGMWLCRMLGVSPYTR
jgi:hypothetical protein